MNSTEPMNSSEATKRAAAKAHCMACACWNSPAWARRPSAACCSPIWARKSSASRDPTRQRQPFDAILDRGRIVLTVDLKQSVGVETCRALAGSADALIEGFRPGVLEKLGLGPDVLLKDNPKLVYGRMTGWGQYGPNAHTAGHDINYIALSGALHSVGDADKPTPPLNLVGDFGGGALYLAMGVLAALLNARSTGVGQVVDCAMTDGAASLMSMMFAMRASGDWREQRHANLLDGGAPFYDTYRCADDKWICVGALGDSVLHGACSTNWALSVSDYPNHWDPACWPGMRRASRRFFKARRKLTGASCWRTAMRASRRCCP